MSINPFKFCITQSYVFCSSVIVHVFLYNCIVLNTSPNLSVGFTTKKHHLWLLTSVLVQFTNGLFTQQPQVQHSNIYSELRLLLTTL